MQAHTNQQPRVYKTILITGGAGFIGSHVVRLFVNRYRNYRIINLDALTYAGNLENISDIEKASNYVFEKVNILDAPEIDRVFEEYKPDGVIHLAAESHVDRSISNPVEFAQTNIIGTMVLLNAAKKHWQNNFANKLFHHVSTDEVFGALGETGLFTETTAYDPQSPYAASKASSDHFVRAYANTFGLPALVTNCSNNYGPNQFPEKLIPLCINNIISNKSVPVYGDGLYTRDWLYVVDHASAIDTIFHKGLVGESYNIGGWNEMKNIDVVRLICRLLDNKLNREVGESEKLITFVKDRPGHDRRYAIDASRLMKELGWKPARDFETGISETVDWYLENKDWLEHVTSGAYRQYYESQYAQA